MAVLTLQGKMYKWIFVLSLVPALTIAQDNKRLVDRLKDVTDMPYTCDSEKPYAHGCGCKLFWQVVQRKQTIVPLLIDKITDTTSTKVYVPYVGGFYAVGDVAYDALTEIIDGIPTFELLGVEYDEHGCGYCSYWNHLRRDIENRRKFQNALRDWYERNKSKLVWVPTEERFPKYHREGMFKLQGR